MHRGSSAAFRSDFMWLFREHGITEEEVSRMTDEEIQRTLNAFYDDPTPPPPRRSPSVPPARNRTSLYNGGLDEEEALRRAQELSLGVATHSRRSPNVPPAGNRAMLYNGGLDEDEALRRAQEASIDDMLIPPSQRRRPNPEDEIPSRSNRPRSGRSSSVAPNRRPNPKPTPLPKPAPKHRVPEVLEGTRPKIVQRARQENVAAKPSTVAARKPAITGTKQPTPTVRSRVTPTSGIRGTGTRGMAGVTGRETKPATKVGTTGTSRKRANPVVLDRPEDIVRMRRGTERVELSAKPPVAAGSKVARQTSRPRREEPSKPAARKAEPQKEPSEFVRELEAIRQQQIREVAAKRKRALEAELEEIDDDWMASFTPSPGIDEPPPAPPQRTRPTVIDKPSPQRLVVPERIDEPAPAKPKTPPKERVLTASQQLRRDQDDEYVRAMEIQRLKDQEEERQRRKEEEDQREQEEQQINREDEVRVKFQALPPEPAAGTTVAVMMPNRARIMRKFDPQSKGELLYVWVAGQTIGTDDKLFLDSFNLKNSVGGTVIAKNEPIDEQGLSGRVMLVIDVL